jgi:hypothetical protein
MNINTLKLFCKRTELLQFSANHVAMFRDDIRDDVHMVGRNKPELILHTH